MSTEDIKKMIMDFIHEEEGAAEATVMDTLNIDDKPTADLIQDWMDINEAVDKWLEESPQEGDPSPDEIEEARLAILEIIDIEIDMRHNR